MSAFLSQNETVITNWDDSITKCDSYYKMGCILQNTCVKNKRQALEELSTEKT